MSSNIANEPFYNSHGFRAVSDVIVGDENPAWNKDPVDVQVVSATASRRASRTDKYEFIDGEGAKNSMTDLGFLQTLCTPSIDRDLRDGDTGKKRIATYLYTSRLTPSFALPPLSAVRVGLSMRARRER